MNQRAVRFTCAYLLSGVACVADTTVETGTRIECSDGSECPPSYVCSAAGLCALASELAAEPPDLLEPPSVTPSAGGRGAEFVVRLRVSGELDGPPSLTLFFALPIEVECSSAGDDLYECRYLATGDENDGRGGQVAFDVILHGRAFNTVTKRQVGTLHLDFAAPELVSASVSPSAARVAVRLDVYLTVNEPLAGIVLQSSAPLITADGPRTQFELTPEAGTLNYRFAHRIGVGDPEGERVFSADLTDISGNVRPGVMVGRAVVDTVPPEARDILLTPATAVPLAAGTVVQVTFSVGEPLREAPPFVRIGDDVMDCGPPIQPPPDPAHVFACTYTVPNTAGGDGPRTIVAELEDPAGNFVAAHLGDRVFDLTPPAVVAGSESVTLRLGPEHARDDCVAVYDFDEGAGARANDLVSPIANGLTLSNTQWTTGRFGKALDFNGVDAAASAAAPSGIPLGVAPRTLAAWIRPRAYAAGDASILGYGEQTCIGHHDNIKIDAAGHAVSAYDCNRLDSPAAPVPLGVWTHIASTFDGTTRRLYQDAIEVASDLPLAVGVDTLYGPITVGSVSGFNGQIDDARIYSRALSQAEILALATQGPSSSACRYVPAIEKPSAASPGTAIRVGFALSEAVSGYPTLTAVAPGGAETLVFAPISSAGGVRVYEHVLSGTLHVQGAYAFALQATDLAGNASPPLSLGEVVIDTLPPPPPDTLTPDRLTYERRPWGTDASAALIELELNGSAGAAEASGFVFAFDVGSPTVAAVLGNRGVDGSGGFGPLDLGRVDHSVIHAAVADAAGNLSPLTEVRNVNWTATLIGKQPGSAIENPHQLRLVAQLDTRSLEQDPNFAIEAGAPALQDVGRLDGALATFALRRPGWVVPMLSGAVPVPDNARMVFDQRRGRAVLQRSGQTWEWDGRLWRQQLAAGPTGLGSLAYDAGRGRTVYLGDTETWEWDGLQWEQRQPATSPPVISGFVAAYDSRRGRTVIFGGSAGGPPLQTTWEWDGADWTQRASAAVPPATVAGCAYFDTVRDVMVVAGSGGTWEWDGWNWANAAAAPGSLGACTFDEANGLGVLVSAGSTWTRSDGAWTQACALGGCQPSDQEPTAIAYDTRRRRAVMISLGSFGDSMWEWTGAAWLERTPSAATPPLRTNPAASYLGATSSILLFGGMSYAGTPLGDTWLWLGNGWHQRCVGDFTCSAQPPPRMGAGLARRYGAGKLIMFGGPDSDLSDTWEWNGSDWLEHCLGMSCPGPNPDATGSGNSVASSANQNVLLCLKNGDEIWEWTGADWELRCQTPGMACANQPTTCGLMAYDIARGTTVLYGGNGGTWEWASGAWSHLLPDPMPQLSPAMLSYDDTRGRVLLLGVNSLFTSTSETWEWDGLAWRQLVLDNHPSVLGPGSMVVDDWEGLAVQFGGITFGSSGTYVMNNHPSLRPGMVLSFEGAGAATRQTVRSISVSAHIGGRGNTTVVPGPGAGVAADGADLGVWDALSGGWRRITANTQTTTAPMPVVIASTTAAEAARWIDQRGAIHARIGAASGQGNGTGPSDVSLDYVQVTVSYERGLAALWDWNVDGDREAWTPGNIATPGNPAGGVWAFDTAMGDPILYSPLTWIDADRHKRVRVHMSNTGSASGELFWWRSDTASEGNQHQRFDISTDGAMHTYEIDLSEHAEWRGIVTRVRLDPNDGGGGAITLDWMRISE